jgi:hypothetical protein
MASSIYSFWLPFGIFKLFLNITRLASFDEGISWQMQKHVILKAILQLYNKKRVWTQVLRKGDQFLLP